MNGKANFIDWLGFAAALGMIIYVLGYELHVRKVRALASAVVSGNAGLKPNDTEAIYTNVLYPCMIVQHGTNYGYVELDRTVHSGFRSREAVQLDLATHLSIPLFTNYWTNAD